MKNSSMRKVLVAYGIPLATLPRKEKNPNNLGKKPGRATGFPVSKPQLQDAVDLYVKAEKLPNPFTENRPGRHWFDEFCDADKACFTVLFMYSAAGVRAPPMVMYNLEEVPNAVIKIHQKHPYNAASRYIFSQAILRQLTKISPKIQTSKRDTQTEKEHFVSSVNFPLKNMKKEKENIKSGFKAAGLSPFNSAAINYDLFDRRGKKNQIEDAKCSDQPEIKVCTDVVIESNEVLGLDVSEKNRDFSLESNTEDTSIHTNDFADIILENASMHYDLKNTANKKQDFCSDISNQNCSEKNCLSDPQLGSAKNTSCTENEVSVNQGASFNSKKQDLDLRSEISNPQLESEKNTYDKENDSSVINQGENNNSKTNTFDKIFKCPEKYVSKNKRMKQEKSGKSK
ncbi:hypothetical protein TKK_0009512 [Trichogramma kaykai]